MRPCLPATSLAPWLPGRSDRCGLRGALHYAVLKGAADVLDIVLSHPQASRRQGALGPGVSLRCVRVCMRARDRVRS
jgi:hypothetical protein